MKATVASSSSSHFCSRSTMRVVVFVSALCMFAATHTEVEVAPVDPLLPICKTVGGGGPYISVNFCMSALGSDSRSQAAGNYQELAVIAVDLVKANATSTAAKIDGLLKNAGRKDDATMLGLRSCKTLYGGILDLLPGVAAAVKAGKFRETTSSLERAASAAKQCEDVFGRGKVASPLTVEDDNEFKLAKLTVALLAVMIN